MRAFLIAIMILVRLLPVISQGQSYRFTRYTVDNGLTQSWVKCIFQDRNGFMWFGTKDGLNKFYGYQFDIYGYNPDVSNSLNHPTVNSVVEDTSGILWIGTNKGLNIYDQGKRKMKSFTGLRNRNISCLRYDLRSTLWIGTDSGLYQLSIPDESIGYMHRNKKDSLLIRDSIQCLLTDRDKNLWAGTNRGLYKVILNRKGDPRVLFISRSDGLLSDNIRSLVEDEKGNIYVGTFAGGVNIFIPGQNFPSGYRILPLLHGSISSLLIDSHGFLWVGHTSGEGLDYFQITRPGELSLKAHFVNKADDPYSISDNSISSMFMDRFGGLWIGTHGNGVCYFDYRTKPFFSVIPSLNEKTIKNPIVNVFYDDGRYFWIGTEDGLSRISKADRSVKIFRHNAGDPSSLDANAVYAIQKDASGNLWVGTWTGHLNLYHDQSGTFSSLHDDHFTHAPLISVYAMYNDRGNFWVGTHGGGLKLLDKNGRSIMKTFLTVQGDNHSLANNSVSAITGYKGYLWVATYNALNRYDYATGSFERYVHNDEDSASISLGDIEVLFTDSRQHLWVGTEGGLNLLLPDQHTFRHFTKANGLPGNAIKAILEDSKGNLWISTNRGISKFISGALAPLKPVFRNFTYEDGLQGNEFVKRSAYSAPDGRMYFGGVNGYTYFYPDSILENMDVPEVVLTRFFLFNKPIDPDPEKGPLFRSVQSVSEIKLAYNQDDVGFSFAALNYFHPDKNRYRYKLEGFETEWKTAGAFPMAFYTNLDPGKYVFRVIASNNDGIWNEKGVSVEIVIAPPWWKTLCFRVILILVVASLLYGVYLIRVKALRRMNLLLEHKVTERTRELNELNQQLEESKEEVTAQNSELEYHRNNLENLVYERTAELEKAMLRAEESDRLKSHFLANISHEIRTPMNAIVGFSNLLLERANTDNERKRYVEIINENCRTLLVLINDLLEISIIESNQMQILKQSFDVDKILVELEQYYRINHSKPIEIKFIRHNDTPLMLDNDAVRFRQIISNLLNNALKFTDSGHIHFGYRIREGMAEFYVADSGIGIHPEDHERVFIMFQKAETESERFYQGAGLGLPISRKLAELMGGTLWFESTFGTGTTFYFTLPIKHAPHTN